MTGASGPGGPTGPGDRGPAGPGPGSPGPGDRLAPGGAGGPRGGTGAADPAGARQAAGAVRAAGAAGRLTARQVIALVADEFTELPPPGHPSARGTGPRPLPDGPLAWDGYGAALARAAERTGEQESVVCGTARVQGTPAVLISFEFGFLGGSLGERTGDRIEAAYAHARRRRLPVVPLIATGGSRMQEGMIALTQLQRVARQSVLAREAGLAQVAVVRDPTTGGGWATLGAGADVVLALPGAQVGFAGSRVRPADADPAAYTAEAQVAAGAVDAVVAPEELRDVLGRWLRLLTASRPAGSARHSSAHSPGPASGRSSGPASAHSPGPASGHPSGESAEVPAGHPPGECRADAPRDSPRGPYGGPAGDPSEGSGHPPDDDSPNHSPDTSRDGFHDDSPEASPEASAEPATPPAPLGALGLPESGWEAVRRARAPERPRAQAYLDAYFTERAAISGDRCGGTDPGMLCGFGTHDGRTVAYAAQCGTATRPAGYRTATRLIRLADRLGIPVLTLVDTPGAANDAEAERQGAGAAIAELFAAVAGARTPVTTLVIGEGGSGGALALAAPGNTWATPDSYFSVIAPELAAAILKRPATQIRATAGQLRLRPQDLAALGVSRTVDRPLPGTSGRRP